MREKKRTSKNDYLNIDGMLDETSIISKSLTK